MAKPVVIGMPQEQDIGPTYTLRVTAIDPTSGNLVAGVVVNTVVLDVTLLKGTTDGLATGEWFLMPGPGA